MQRRPPGPARQPVGQRLGHRRPTDGPGWQPMAMVRLALCPSVAKRAAAAPAGGQALERNAAYSRIGPPRGADGGVGAAGQRSQFRSQCGVGQEAHVELQVPCASQSMATRKKLCIPTRTSCGRPPSEKLPASLSAGGRRSTGSRVSIRASARSSSGASSTCSRRMHGPGHRPVERQRMRRRVSVNRRLQHVRDRSRRRAAATHQIRRAAAAPRAAGPAIRRRNPGCGCSIENGQRPVLDALALISAGTMASGKVDRRALRGPDSSKAHSAPSKMPAPERPVNLWGHAPRRARWPGSGDASLPFGPCRYGPGGGARRCRSSPGSPGQAAGCGEPAPARRRRATFPSRRPRPRTRSPPGRRPARRSADGAEAWNGDSRISGRGGP